MTDLPKMAHDRCVAQIAESLFGQPGMTLMEMAGRREEIEALVKDAGRYEWIRRNAVLDGTNGDQLDSEIDAAMKEQAE